MKQKSSIAILVGLLILVVLLIGVGKVAKPGAKLAVSTDQEKRTTVPCLPNGHTNLALHTHQLLSIVVDGQNEIIPANIGISGDCMAEVHTHETDGKIHVETAQASKEHTLNDFFSVWGRDIERPGYALIAIINADTSEDPGSHVLRDGDVITLSYTTEISEE